MQFLAVRETVLCVEARPLPGRPTIVFANSLGTDLRSWNRVVDALAGRFGTLRYDKRGHGLSSLGVGAGRIATHADDLSTLLDLLDLRNVVLCGLSVGGMIAQSVGARRPDRVRRLILFDTAHRIGTPEMWNTRIATVRRDGMSAIADTIMQRWFSPPFIARGGAELEGWRNMLLRTDPAGYNAVCEALRDADLTALAATIAQPTLVLCGDQDAATPPDLVRSLAALIPGARFELIANAGHLPCVEQPEATARHIAHFAEA